MKKQQVIVLALCGLLSLSGCSAKQASGDDVAGSMPAVANVQVDSATESIKYPINQYKPSKLDSDTVAYANDLLINACMEKSGDRNPGAKIDRRKFTSDPDRTFGIWSLERAAKWGYGLPPEDDQRKKLTELNGKSADSVFEACVGTRLKPGTVKQIAEPIDPDPSVSPSEKGMEQSLSEAAGDSRYKKAVSAWKTCMANAGLPPLVGDELTPKGVSSMSKEEQISTAVKDVTCKDKVRLVQRLASIVAGYQVLYIKSHEAALVQERQRTKKLLTVANKVINDLA